MSVLSPITTLLARDRGAWDALSLEALQYWHRDTARLALVAFAATMLLLLLRRGFGARGGRIGLAVPAVLRPFVRSHAAWLRHAPMLAFAAGLPPVLFALADPYSPLVTRETSFPGRRISLMIDASTSMQTSFTSETLPTRSKTGPAFFTTVAAAERFVEMRMKGQYRDLMALVEFGNQAYVITPFTNDYENILTSIALISDPVEFALFPDRGTIIARAVEQSLSLFDAFNFLEAAGNLMVIFTDGEDTTAIVHGRSLDDILASAVQNRIPLFFVRTNYRKALGEIIPDALWKAAVEKTGGRFYAVNDEASLLRAIADIDRQATGAIHVKQYTSQQPQFALFALLAAGLWTIAAALKLTLPYFQTVP